MRSFRLQVLPQILALQDRGRKWEILCGLSANIAGLLVFRLQTAILSKRKGDKPWHPRDWKSACDCFAQLH